MLTYRIQRINQIADISLKHVDQSDDRCLHAAQNAGNEDFSRRQAGQSLYAIGVNNLAFDQAAFDFQNLVFLRKLGISFAGATGSVAELTIARGPLR